jgi:hypothetical protein
VPSTYQHSFTFHFKLPEQQWILSILINHIKSEVERKQLPCLHHILTTQFHEEISPTDWHKLSRGTANAIRIVPFFYGDSVFSTDK